MDLELCISQRPSSSPASNDKLHFSQRHTASWRDFLRALLFARRWQIFSPAWELRSGLPLRVTIALTPAAGLEPCPVLSEERSREAAMFAIWPLGCHPGRYNSSFKCGHPKAAGLIKSNREWYWLNDKTGHFVNSCLLAHKLKNETWGFKMPFVEKEMATHSSILAWKNPWTEESGGLKSTGLHDWACVHEDGGRWVGSNKLVELKINK